MPLSEKYKVRILLVMRGQCDLCNRFLVETRMLSEPEKAGKSKDWMRGRVHARDICFTCFPGSVRLAKHRPPWNSQGCWGSGQLEILSEAFSLQLLSHPELTGSSLEHSAVDWTPAGTEHKVKGLRGKSLSSVCT